MKPMKFHEVNSSVATISNAEVFFIQEFQFL